MLRQLRRTAIKATAATIGLGVAVEVTTHLPSEGRSSQFYHDVSDKLVMPLVRLCLNPELAHNLAIEAVRSGWGPRQRRVGNGEEWRVKMESAPFGTNKQLVFPNPVGLAAGFDKDGVAIKGMMELGFGFVEIGSVTPLPQPGNPKPRMFRLTEDRAVINRYGFNSTGVDAVGQNLRDFVADKDDVLVERSNTSGGKSSSSFSDIWKSTADGEDVQGKVMHVVRAFFAYFSAYIPTRKQPVPAFGMLGVNLGKNKTSADEIADYSLGIRRLGPYADYLVVNISSPNTPGLRGLQRREPLRRLLDAAVAERNALPPSKSAIPLLVKIAPDVTDQELEDIAAVVKEAGIDGVIISNTSTYRPDTLVSLNRKEAGGLSGAPIRQMSTECIRKFYALTDGSIPIIGVGGVGSGHDAYEKLKAGASLVEIYSMMVYEGPGVVSRIRGELAGLMVQNGQRSVEDVVGLDHEDIYWRKREERMKEELSMETLFVEE